jgi:hypothetical protein
MTRFRPAASIQHELDTARAYRSQCEQRPSTDPLVLSMRSANEAEITQLERELAHATSGELEVTLAGRAFDDHRIGVPLVSRVLETLQATFRAAYRSASPHQRVGRGEATLSLVATATGSFRLILNTPPAQLDLQSAPVADQAMGSIVGLLDAAGRGNAGEAGPVWAQHAEEPLVRSMIRLAATLAGTHGTTNLRWKTSSQNEQLVSVPSDQARSLAVALAGQAGREIVTVTGHLEMGQDQPPRVRVRTADDEYLARVPTQLLERVKELLFEEIQATLIVDMKTSPTTGSPDTEIELLDLSEL